MSSDKILWTGQHGEGKLTFVLSGDPASICSDHDGNPIVLYFFEYAGTKCEGHVHVEEPVEASFHANFESVCTYIGNHYRSVIASLEAEAAEAKSSGHLH